MYAIPWIIAGIALLYACHYRRKAKCYENVAMHALTEVQRAQMTLQQERRRQTRNRMTALLPSAN